MRGVVTGRARLLRVAIAVAVVGFGLFVLLAAVDPD
jgi:hypothetical protein